MARKTKTLELNATEATTLLYALRAGGDGSKRLHAKLLAIVTATRSEKAARATKKATTR